MALLSGGHGSPVVPSLHVVVSAAPLRKMTMLIVLEPAKKTDLTLIATVRTELEISDRSMDVQLRAYIKQASNTICGHCNRTFAKETFTEGFRASNGASHLIFSRYPVESVVSVVSGGVTLPADGYEIDHANGFVHRVRNGDPLPWSPGKTVITYRAGYDLPAGLPEGVERACILLVKMYASAGDRDPMIRSETIEGAGSAEYFSGAGTGLPPEVVGLLQPHVRPNGV